MNAGTVAETPADRPAPNCRNRQGLHKLPYATWEDAERACYEMWREEADPGLRTLFAYLAPCGAWHIGHQRLNPPGR